MTHHHVFEIRGEWAGGVGGRGSLSWQGGETAVSVPGEMGGQGIGTNPEELLLAASASCYMISLASVLQYRRLPFEVVRIRSEAVFERLQGPVLRAIRHFPEVVLRQGASLEDQRQAQTCLRLADRVCMVSSALRGSVSVEVDGRVLEQDLGVRT